MAMIVLWCAVFLVLQADQPQWGHAWTRNMVSAEVGLVDEFDVESGRNVKWVARLGSETHSTPVIADGRVYIGTNNEEPRDPKHQGDRGVLMCFQESDGQLLWQLVSPKRIEDPYFDWPLSGISSPATVEKDRVYIVSNRGDVLCLDARGMANGNDGPFVEEGQQMTPVESVALVPGPLDADILWKFNMTEGAGIWSHDGAHSSILIHGNHLYLNTGTGVDNSHVKIRRPEAPSLVVLDKVTGELIARDVEGIGPNIFHCTWSAPSLAHVNGKALVFFAAGNGFVYAFEALDPTATAGPEPLALRKVWHFDFDPDAPKTDVHRYNKNKREGPSNFYGMPVFHDGKLYVVGGGDLWWGKNGSWLKCLDPTPSGDLQAPALQWTTELGRHVFSTPAVHEDLVFIADTSRQLHCLDRITGHRLWMHECDGDFWASPYVADGKVYIGSRRGGFWIFEASKTKRILFQTPLVQPISATATAANGVLYVATMTHLYALQPPKKRVAIH